MICCIVGLVILTVVGRIRRVLGLGRGPQPELFAPVARWPGPGQAPVVVSAGPAPADGPAPANVLRYCALAVGICLAGIPMLVLSGALRNTGSPLAWALRCAGYLAVVAVAISLSRSAQIWRAPRGAGTVLIILGAVVFESGVLDMHVFGLFDIDQSNLLATMAFHNVGPVLAMAGGAVLLYGSMGRSATSRRPSRSTVTVARPESSAITVSSTPPITS